MTRVRVIGRRAELPRTLAALQDVGTLHLTAPAATMTPHAPTPLERRRQRHLTRALADVDAALASLATLGAEVPEVAATAPVGLARAAWCAARVRRRAAALVAEWQARTDERDALRAFAPLFTDLEALLGDAHAHHRFTVHLLRLRDGAMIKRLREVLDRVLGEHDLRARALPGGEVALLLLAPTGRAADVERLLVEAAVESAPVPLALGGGSLREALARLRPRLAEVEARLAQIADEVAALAGRDGPTLTAARRALRDALAELDARALAGETPRAFVLEGWTPARTAPALIARLRQDVPEVSAVEVAHDTWRHSGAPVVLTNPPIFEPFERLTAMLPLPRYGSVDPTPFVAVFFPMLFGLIVGDIGYGALVAVIALVLWRRGRQPGLAHDLARIAAAVAAYTIIFGALFGELFGDLGLRAFGLRPLWMDRHASIMPFLGLAVSIGLVHLVLGLVTAAVARRHHPREAAGRGLAALMLVLVGVTLAALLELLPSVLFTPALVVLLVAFPVLVVLEGATALLELITTLGHVLSYARVMALGTASVMLAMVANRMVGAFGGAVIGVLFALVFHLVNFAIAMFSPTIHVLRLHYVEFFGTFFDPGGDPYRPFAHWHPQPVPEP
ncbi:MAG: hypothetical protein IPL61_26260 [Myxococcales bacterium]|nr:hypothetical protein [Myxococcales bacterium]